MSNCRRRAHELYNLLLIFLLALSLPGIAPGRAFGASFFSAEDVAELAGVRDRLRDEPALLTEEQKSEILEAIDREFGTLNPSFAPLADPANREFLSTVREMVELLGAKDAGREEILRKLNALDRWFEETSELAKVFEPPAGGSGAGVVKEFSGSNTSTTRPFAVRDDWEIQWEYAPAAATEASEEGAFILKLYDRDGGLVDIVASQVASGPGSAYRPSGGRYYLEINALGAWTVRIVQVPR